MTNKHMSPNHREAITAVSSITGLDEYINSTNGAININGTIGGSPLPISGATTGVGVAILDGSGNQITSFGGGTQYTDGGVPPANPVGPTLIFDNAGTWANVSDANPLPVSGSFTPPALQNVNITEIGGNAVTTTVPVSGTVAATQSGAWNITNISGTVSLPTGAATAANQTNASQKTQIVDGSGNIIASSNNSLQVVQPDVVVGPSNITNTQSVTFTNNGLSGLGILITGTYTGTISVEGSVDGTTWSATTMLTLASGSPVTSVTAATGNYQANIAGLAQFRLRGNTVASGTAVVTLRGNVSTPSIMLDNSLPAGSATIGSVGINGGSNNIGSVNLRDGSGNALTSNSTTTAAKTALDQNVISILGTAPTTAGFLDIKGADGNVFVRQATASNLNATVVGTGTFVTQSTLQTQTDTTMIGGVNIKEINAVTPLMGNGVTGTGSLRVTIASDNTAFTVNAAQSGTWTVQPGNTPNSTPWLVTDTPSTSGGLSIVTGSVGATATAIKASAGQLYGYHLFNTTAAVAYVQIFNVAAASVTLGTTAPTISIGIPASGGVTVNFDKGIAFGTAISYACTTTRAGSSGATCDVNFFYK